MSIKELLGYIGVPLLFVYVMLFILFQPTFILFIVWTIGLILIEFIIFFFITKF